MKISQRQRDKIESIIHSYAVNHYNAPDWRERRQVRSLALDDLIKLFETFLKSQKKSGQSK